MHKVHPQLWRQTLLSHPYGGILATGHCSLSWSRQAELHVAATRASRADPDWGTAHTHTGIKPSAKESFSTVLQVLRRLVLPHVDLPSLILGSPASQCGCQKDASDPAPAVFLTLSNLRALTPQLNTSSNHMPQQGFRRQHLAGLAPSKSLPNSWDRSPTGREGSGYSAGGSAPSLQHLVLLWSSSPSAWSHFFTSFSSISEHHPM